MLIKELLAKNEKGFVLPMGLIFLAILSIIGITAIVLTTMDIKIGKNYQTSEQAFHDAESGINFAMGCIQNCLDDGTLTLPESINGTVSISMCSRPSGFSFTLSDVTKVDDNKYFFTSTGSSSAGGAAKIEASFRKGIAINYAAFGDLLIDMKADSSIHSYDSGDFVGGEDEDDLEADDSTTEGDVGSNGTVSVKNNTIIDGDVALGDDGGDPVNEAVYTHTGTQVITGTTGVDVERVDPEKWEEYFNSMGAEDTKNDLELKPFDYMEVFNPHSYDQLANLCGVRPPQGGQGQRTEGSSY